MAERAPHPDTPELRARYGAFAWTEENAAKVKAIIARYPQGRQRSAVMPLLFLAQGQIGAAENTQGWLPLPVIEFVAKQLDMPVIRVLEVATFYMMYNIAPVGQFHVQICGTTPCMLRGSDDLFDLCDERGMKKGHTTADGMWTLTEVECMGNCATAPMAQINEANYEDLTRERLEVVLDMLARGERPKEGTHEPGRHTSEPLGGLTSLREMADANHDYRGEW